MFAGHIGAALVIGRAERAVNVGVFIAAALLLDLLLWLFVLLGWEAVAIPPDFASTHQPQFVFPYSHGLAASIFWSALAGAIGLAFFWRLQSRWRIAALVAAAVFSHWVLDAVVHRSELPLAGRASRTVGLGLWNNMPVALALEAAIVVAGLYLFVSGARVGRGRSIALVVLTLVTLAITAVGMTVAPAPPSATAMAASSLVTLLVVCALLYWFGRLRERV
jgi:hypothetical protein